jgi:hypothetical protein
MSREEHALEGVRSVIPDDEILDVALTYPRGSTVSMAEGMAIGGLAGYGTGMEGVGMALGGFAAPYVLSGIKEMPLSVVLAISPSSVYVLGRNTASPFGGWDELKPMVKFDRAKLRAEARHAGPLLAIKLTDTEHDVSLELEAKPVGSLDAKAIMDTLQPTLVAADKPQAT